MISVILRNLPGITRSRLNRMFRLVDEGSDDKFYVMKGMADGTYEWSEIGSSVAGPTGPVGPAGDSIVTSLLDTDSINLTATDGVLSAAAIFGTTGTTVAEGDHTHSGVYHPINYVAKTANYTTIDTDDLVDCNTSGGTFTLTLMSATTFGEGRSVTISKTDVSATKLSIATTSLQTIDGLTSFDLYGRVSITLTSNESNWIVTSGKEALGSAINVQWFGAKGDGSTNDSTAFSSAMDVVIVRRGRLIIPGTANGYLIDTAITKTLAANDVLVIEGIGRPKITFGAGDSWTFGSTSVATTTLNGNAAVGDRTLTLTSTTGMAVGDLVFIAVPLWLETTYNRNQTEVHRIRSVDSGTQVTLCAPLEFAMKTNADHTWTGDSVKTVYWYPSYFVASANIQVYVNGVLQTLTTHYTIAAHSGGSDNNGWDITFLAAPGAVPVVIKNSAKIPVAVNRPGKLRISDLHLTAAVEATYVTASGLSDPEFRRLRLDASAKSTVGDYLNIQYCLAPIVDGIDVKYGRYAVHIQGDRDARVSRVTGVDCWHAVSISQWSVDTFVENVVGHKSQAVVDAHPSIRSHYRNVTDLSSETGTNNRGIGGSMKNVNVVAIATTNANFTNGIVWQDDGQTDGPATYRNYRESFLMDNCSFVAPNQATGYLIVLSKLDKVVLRGVVVEVIGTQGTFAQLGINTLMIEDCDIGILATRAIIKAVRARGGRIGAIDFGDEFASCPHLTADGVRFDRANVAMTGDLGNSLDYREFSGCLFTGHDDLITNFETSATKKKRYDFRGCTFTDVVAISASIKSNGGSFQRCIYTGTTVHQEIALAKTTTYTATPTDDVISCDATGAAFTVTLPTVANAKSHPPLTIKRTNGGANAVIVDGSGAETIDGTASKSLDNQYAAITIKSNGTIWQIISQMGTVT